METRRGCRCCMRNSILNFKKGIVRLDIVHEHIPEAPCQQCQNIPSSEEGEAPVMQNNPVEGKEWCYETPREMDKMWARSTSKLGVRFGTPGFTPMKKFDFKVQPTPLPKQIPPIEPETPTPIKCMRSPSP